MSELLTVVEYDRPPSPLRSFLAQFLGSAVLVPLGFVLASVRISADLRAITLSWVTLPSEEAYLWLAAAAAMVIALGAAAPSLQQPFLSEGQHDPTIAQIFEKASLNYQLTLRRLARIGARFGAVLGMFVGCAGAADHWTHGYGESQFMRGALVLMLANLLTFTASVLVGALGSGLGNLGPWYASHNRALAEEGLNRFYFQYRFSSSSAKPPRAANVLYYSGVVVLLSLFGGVLLLAVTSVYVRATAPADIETTLLIALVSVLFGASSVLATSAAVGFWQSHRYCQLLREGKAIGLYRAASAFLMLGAVALLVQAMTVFAWWMVVTVAALPALWMVISYKWPQTGSGGGLSPTIAYMILTIYRTTRTRTAPPEAKGTATTVEHSRTGD